MATIYFTNNADSGDGSLRAAIASSESGDVIAPDPTAFAPLETITILLSSALSLDKRTTFDAGAKTIVLDGQSSTRLINSITTSDTDPFIFTGFHFVRGKISGGGCFYCSNDSDKYVFNRCLFAGGEATNYGGAVYVLKGEAEFNNCIITGSKIAYENNGGGVRVANTVASATFNDCTIVGNAGSDVSVQTNAPATFTNCIIGRVGVGVAIETSGAHSAIGFVSAPPDVISNSDWTVDAWQDYDLRLKPSSSFLTGSGARSERDILGHLRKATGAVGAYEGAWIVARENETIEINANTTADYFEGQNGATINFIGVDRELVIEEEANVGAVQFVAADDSSGYFAIPERTETDAATFSGVKRCTYCAKIFSFDAYVKSSSKIGFRITKERDLPVLIERLNGSTWQTVTAEGTEESETPIGVDVRATFRAYDGSVFLHSVLTIPDFSDFWKVDGWAVEAAGGADENGGESLEVVAWGISPNIKED